MPEKKSKNVFHNKIRRSQRTGFSSANRAASICKVVSVNAGVQEVWQAWTTEAGCTSFFAPECHIDLCIGGAYEMYFMPEADPGVRGGEGCIILAIEDESMLSFTWNAPPNMPEIRAQFTHVTVYLESESEQKTRLTLVHDGWGVGELWDRAFAYFDNAWGEIVLPRLQHRFASGPVNWRQLLSHK